MRTRNKILIGGLGALTPILMNLLVVDLNVLLLNATGLAVAGYVLRVVILFYLGGLIAYFHKQETSPVKLFELGIAAPALVTALLNANHVEIPKLQAHVDGIPAFSEMITSSAYAQPAPPTGVSTFSITPESSIQQVLRGLTGARPRNVWFVIAGSYPTLDEAKAQADRMMQSRRGFQADVYAPTEENPSYSVVIGANLTREQAEQLRREAVGAALAPHIVVWPITR